MTKAAAKGASKKSTVTIYSTPTCPYCKLTKDFLNEHKIKYKDINVADNEGAANEMIEKSGQTGVPVIEIDGKIVVGFDKEGLKKLLNIR